RGAEKHDDVPQEAEGSRSTVTRLLTRAAPIGAATVRGRGEGYPMKIVTFDTTLRDGTQGESVSFSVDDKLTIARKLDELGIDYIEGGWPGSNPKDRDFFARASELNLQHAKLTELGSTRFAKNAGPAERHLR